jgi:hypothetical protein
MSTVHGNAYISEKKHCLSPVPIKSAKPPKDIEAVAGKQVCAPLLI